MISDSSGSGYNMMLSVQGTNKKRVGEIMLDLQKELGVETKRPPEFLIDKAKKVRKEFRKMFDKG